VLRDATNYNSAFYIRFILNMLYMFDLYNLKATSGACCKMEVIRSQRC